MTDLPLVVSTFDQSSVRPVPMVTAAELRELDELVAGRFAISLVQMMENAGRGLAEMVIQEYRPESVVVMVGPGHNGGGGLVAARHLVNRGVHVVAVPVRTDQLSPTTAHQLKTLREMGVPLVQVAPPASVLVDALIGYSLEGEPRGRFAELIDWANEQSSPVISLDIPSGLDATTGRISGHCIRADATLTLALPKTGLAISPSVVGRLSLADIAFPRAAYELAGLDVPLIFRSSSIVRLVRGDGDYVAG